MEKFFELKERGTDVRTEVMAGITTFITMSYILAVNPLILSAAGMEPGAVFTATALASALATSIMACYANMPFVLSAGMGLNAYMSYTCVLTMGYTWSQALAAIFVEGIIFIFLSLVNIREAIFNAIPPSLKIAVSVGIGLFISFIGLQNAHIVVAGPTLVTLYSFKHSVEGGMFQSEGITVLLALIGLLITAFLLIKNVKGSVLFGIIATWGLGMICQATGLYVPNPEKGFFSLFPNGIISMPASLEPTFMQVDFSSVLSFEFFSILMAFLFVDLFDTIGTVIGCATKANLLDKDGKLPKVKQVLLTDAIGTTAGSLLGTSTITTFVESSAGIIFTGIIFLADILGNSCVRDGSRADNRRLPHDATSRKNQLDKRRAHGGSGLHNNFLDGVHVFNLGGNLFWRHKLHAVACRHGQSQRSHAADVHFNGAVYFEIRVTLIRS